jgi:hypothetical protein
MNASRRTPHWASLMELGVVSCADILGPLVKRAKNPLLGKNPAWSERALQSKKVAR